MPKSSNAYVAELNATLDAMTAAGADGHQVIAIALDAWMPPRLLLVSRPALADLPGAYVLGPTPDGGEEWAAPYHGCLVTWFRDLPVADINRLPAGSTRRAAA